MNTHSNKHIWQITYPVLISLLMEYLIGMTDTAFLGRVGEVELGATALAGVYFMAFYMIGFGFSVGAQILMARRNGERKFREIGAVFQQAIVFLLLLALILFGVSKYVSPRILSQTIESPAVFGAAMDYLNWRIYGFFFAFIALIFRSFYVATTRTKVLTLNSVVMVLANVVLNYILIFGKFGFPALGIAGAAIASSLSEAISVLFFVVYTYVKVDWRKYRLYQYIGFSFPILSSILRVSVWTMLQSFLSVTVWFIFFLAIEHLGERPLAISNIVRSISGIVFMITHAFAATTSSLVSNLMGEGRPNAVWPLSKKVIRMAYMIVLPISMLIVLFPAPVLHIYTNNVPLIESSIASLRVMVSSYVISVPAFIWFNTVSGTGNTKAGMIMEMITLALYSAYVYVIVVRLKSDVAVCWTTEHVYGGILLIFMYLYLRKANWQNKKI